MRAEMNSIVMDAGAIRGIKKSAFGSGAGREVWYNTRMKGKAK